MTDQRPQYGELATPEEQRRAAGLPPLDAAPLLPAAPASASAPDAAPRPISSVDRTMTIVLLAMGLVNVVSSVPGLLDLASTMNRTLELLGLDGEFTAYESARTWGSIAVVVLLAGFGATAWFAFRRLKARRLAWWIPIVGCIVVTLLMSICISVPMFADPAFMQGLQPPAP